MWSSYIKDKNHKHKKLLGKLGGDTTEPRFQGLRRISLIVVSLKIN